MAQVKGGSSERAVTWKRATQDERRNEEEEEEMVVEKKEGVDSHK